MTRLAVLSLLWGALGCADGPRLVGAEPTLLWEHAASAPASAPAPPLSDEEARNLAAAHDAAYACEATARVLRAHDSASGWKLMEQCVQRPDFSDLEGLLGPPWLERVAAHPEAGRLLAHVIAARGGDVSSDLRLCRRARIPLFSLKAAEADPASYQGRLVLLLGAPRESETVGGQRAVLVEETRIMAESEWVVAGPRASTTTSASSSGTEATRTSWREETRRSEEPKVEVLHNVSVETGREVLVDVGDDPFLEIGTDYVLLLRFQGTRDAVRGSVLEEQPVATLVAYFEPTSGLFARLGR